MWRVALYHNIRGYRQETRQQMVRQRKGTKQKQNYRHVGQKETALALFRRAERQEKDIYVQVEQKWRKVQQLLSSSL
jgi:hypothetical protein